MLRWVLPCKPEPTSLQSLFSRFLQRYLGIGAEGKQVPLAVCLAELHTPDPLSAGRNVKVEAAAIEQLVRLLFWLRFPDRQICQRNDNLAHQ